MPPATSAPHSNATRWQPTPSSGIATHERLLAPELSPLALRRQGRLEEALTKITAALSVLEPDDADTVNALAEWPTVRRRLPPVSGRRFFAPKQGNRVAAATLAASGRGISAASLISASHHLPVVCVAASGTQ